MTDQDTSNQPATEAATRAGGRLRRYTIECSIGVALAALVLWAITAAGGDVTFVYQGL